MKNTVNTPEISDYEKQANDFLKLTNATLTPVFWQHSLYFDDDKTPRDIYKITLKKDGKQYTFKFGQSINNTGKCPTNYDVLTCLTKYDPGTFENFCSDYGYDTDSRKAEKVYKEVCKEYSALASIFTSEELELMAEIQ